MRCEAIISGSSCSFLIFLNENQQFRIHNKRLLSKNCLRLGVMEIPPPNKSRHSLFVRRLGSCRCATIRIMALFVDSFGWRTLLRTVIFFALLGSISPVVVGCDSTSGRPGGANSPDGHTCGQRLVGGSWKIVEFQPEQPMDPTSASTLRELHSSLRITFDGSLATTTGQGVNHTGPYQTANDDGLRCRITAPDSAGVVTFTDIRFLDPHHYEVIDKRSAVPSRAVWERTAQ
jgi:hypothetical protein